MNQNFDIFYYPYLIIIIIYNIIKKMKSFAARLCELEEVRSIEKKPSR
jgi:hypothetical protein